VNRKGVFNVPIGKQGLQGSPKIVDEDALKAAEAALEKVELSCNDFSAHTPIEGNFYYLDPPYLGVYDGYTQQGFDRSQHQRLAKFCKTIDKAKATFMLSHSDHPTIRKLYQNFHIEEIKARRSVSAKAESRGYVTELIIRNYK
jgi:DNA adenine methylase